MFAKNNLELVCPAGTPAALRYAIEAGADTVYLGFRDETNARNYPGLNFSFDELKSSTSGYASIAYDFAEMRTADVTRLDILLADEIVPAFTRVIARRRALEEAETTVEKLHEVMPRQQFEMKIQGYALGRILASKTIKAFRKDVTGHLYGGDYTRKMKLLEKQKKGKKKMADRGKANIPHEVFLKMMKK
jgi:GTP-binding protein LepA